MWISTLQWMKKHKLQTFWYKMMKQRNDEEDLEKNPPKEVKKSRGSLDQNNFIR